MLCLWKLSVHAAVQPAFEWRVYDVCAAMRQQSERRRQLRLAKPRKQSHHFADAWQARSCCRAIPFFITKSDWGKPYHRSRVLQLGLRAMLVFNLVVMGHQWCFCYQLFSARLLNWLT